MTKRQIIPKRQITSQIRALKSKDKEYLHSVPRERGLYVCVRPDGTKPYAFRYTSPVTGKRRTCLLDQSGDGEFDAAAEVVADYVKQVREGLDPLIEIKAAQDAEIERYNKGIADDQLTLKAMCEWYIGSLYGGLTKEQRDGGEVSVLAKRSAPIVERSFEADVYPLIGSRRAGAIKVEDCTAVADRIDARKAPVQANRVMAYLTAAFNFAFDSKGKRGKGNSYARKMPDFKLALNPAASVERVDEEVNRRASERTLNASEVRRVWREVGGDCMSEQLSIALKLLLSTGQRVEEILGATWSEFSTEDSRGEWAIPMERRKAKAKAQHSEPHIVPLEQLHIDLLAKAKALSGRSKFVFPASNGEARTSNSLNQAVRRYCNPQGDSKRKSLDTFTPRDCRRTFKTLASMAGADDEMLDRLQGHGVNGLSGKHYNRYDKILEKRVVMNTLVQALDVTIKVKATHDAGELRQLMLERFPVDNVVVGNFAGKAS